MPYENIEEPSYLLMEEARKLYADVMPHRIINVIRYGEELENTYVKSVNKRLPGFNRNSMSTLLSSAMTWNRFGLCSFDCGPVLWSKKRFVYFSRVKKHMNQIGWPYYGTASQLLRPLFTIAMNYKRPPIRRRGESDEGYSLKSMRRRSCQLWPPKPQTGFKGIK